MLIFTIFTKPCASLQDDTRRIQKTTQLARHHNSPHKIGSRGPDVHPEDEIFSNSWRCQETPGWAEVCVQAQTQTDVFGSQGNCNLTKCHPSVKASNRFRKEIAVATVLRVYPRFSEGKVLHNFVNNILCCSHAFCFQAAGSPTLSDRLCFSQRSLQ